MCATVPSPRDPDRRRAGWRCSMPTAAAGCAGAGPCSRWRRARSTRRKSPTADGRAPSEWPTTAPAGAPATPPIAGEGPLDLEYRFDGDPGQYLAAAAVAEQWPSDELEA